MLQLDLSCTDSFSTETEPFSRSVSGYKKFERPQIRRKTRPTRMSNVMRVRLMREEIWSAVKNKTKKKSQAVTETKVTQLQAHKG